MAKPRKSLSKKLRFEVFKRDAFTCQYCGQKAPDVVLHVDHISPVSKGGRNDLLNLITACEGCNSGKGARELSDDSALAKQREQLAQMSERREQLAMMVKWREGLTQIEADALSMAEGEIEAKMGGFTLNETGRKMLKDWIRKYGYSAVMSAADASESAHIKISPEGEIAKDSVETFFNKIGGICWYRAQPSDKQALRYIRGIVRNRLSYCRDDDALALLERAHASGIDLDALKATAIAARTWGAWVAEMEGLIDG